MHAFSDLVQIYSYYSEKKDNCKPIVNFKEPEMQEKWGLF